MDLRRLSAALCRAIVFATAGLLAPAVCAGNTVPNLGDAANFGVLGLNNARYAIQSAAIAGNIGIGQGGSVSNYSGAVAGTAYQYASGQITNTGAISGGISTNPTLMANANAAAISAYNTAVANTATQTLGSITTPTTITGNHGLNVVDITNVNLSTENIRLSGNSSDIFVLRVSGDFTMSGNSSILLSPGVTAERVLIVFTGTGKTINIGITGSATVNGTLLAPSASTNWQIASGNFVGEIITGTPASGGGVFMNMNNVNLAGAGFRPIPEPSSLVLAGIAAAGLFTLTRSKRHAIRHAVARRARS